MTFYIKILLFLTVQTLIFPSTYEYYKDSDEDGYTDRQEKHFGSDPFDENSVIYKGGWPYNMYKENLSDPGFGDCISMPLGNGCDCKDDNSCLEGSICGYQFNTRQCVPMPGSKVPRFIGLDQFGDYVDIYDLANQGFPIIIEISTMYMQAPNLLASWFASGDESIYEMKWWQDNFEQMKSIVDAGDVYYVRILHKGSSKGEPIEQGDAAIWHKAYPHLNIITLEDPQEKMKTWFRPTGLPAVFMLDQSLNLKIPAEGFSGDTQMRRGIKHTFEGVIFDNYMKSMDYEKK